METTTDMTLSAAALPHETARPLPAPGLALVYGVLFNPVATFRAIAHAEPPGGRLLGAAVLSVLYISMLAPVLQAVGARAVFGTLAVGIPLAAVSGLLTWLFGGVVFALTAYAFTGAGHLRLLLALSGLATLPWLFMAPVVLLRASFDGPLVFVVLLAGLFIWAWSVALYVLALATTFRLNAERTLAVLALPFMMMLVFIAWSSGFLVNIIRMMPR